MTNHRKIIGYYGRNAMEKDWCPDCEMYSFTIKGEHQCCGKKVIRDWEESISVKHVRFSMGTGKRTYLSQKDKDEILERQNYRCAYCDTDLRFTEIHFDHFIPFSFTFSQIKIGDMVAACSICNLFKSNKIYDSIEDARDDIKGKSERRRRRNEIKRELL